MTKKEWFYGEGSKDEFGISAVEIYHITDDEELFLFKLAHSNFISREKPFDPEPRNYSDALLKYLSKVNINEDKV